VRELLYFIASLAGAAVLTALAVIVPPESALWRGVLYGGIVVLGATSIAILIDMFIPLATMERKAKFTVAGCLAVMLAVGGGWFYAQYPTSLNTMRGWFLPLTAPPKLPPTPPPTPRKVDGTLSASYYKCKDRQMPVSAEEFKAYFEAYANAYGYKTPVVSTVTPAA
jgi:hypothetical protein